MRPCRLSFMSFMSRCATTCLCQPSSVTINVYSSDIGIEVPQTLIAIRLTLLTSQPRLHVPWHCSSSTAPASSVSSVFISVGAAVATSLVQDSPQEAFSPSPSDVTVHHITSLLVLHAAHAARHRTLQPLQHMSPQAHNGPSLTSPPPCPLCERAAVSS